MESTTALPPSASNEPTERAKPAWISSLVLANMGINIAFFSAIQVFLPQQAEAFDPANKEAVLSLALTTGAIVSLVVTPIFGALSDRTASRFGRRLPWIVGGTLLAVVALLVLSGAPGVFVMVAAWCLVQTGANAALAALSAAIPDQVPSSQRGSVSGLFAMGQTVGIMLGALIGAVVSGYAVGYVVAAVALAACMSWFVLRRQDVVIAPGSVSRFEWLPFLRSFWISPRKHPDFAWAWFTRFMVNLGVFSFTNYMFFFLSDRVKYPDPAGGVFILTVEYALSVVLFSVVGGFLSDRVGRRKVFVIAAAAVVCVAFMIVLFTQDWTGALIAAPILGAGFGTFLAVDFALLTEVLPSSADRGKDLGVINVAASLPQVIAPVVAGFVTTSVFGYSGLFVFGAIAAVIGAVFVTRIKGVR
ncbi:MFS transporter [Haematomicrobium sanguinis]|uniref:MFS transporter n=1 Tax=Haematomicrobium sanguinis TaxID=479106 RepID=UPI00047B3DE9|nr:MFS transporter [Haematomicrobium sanguinis]